MTDAPFWNRSADAYAASKIADEASYERKIAETRALLTSLSEVLEIGCGTGTTALRHAPHAGRVVGVDGSDAMVRIARGKAGSAPNVAFELGDVERLDRPDASVDVVMAHSVLHLLRDPRGTVANAFSWLRPGGAFVSSTSCLGGLQAFPVRAILPVMRLVGKAPHVNAFREDDLLSWIRDAGFDIVDHWQPKGFLKALFVVARRPGADAAVDWQAHARVARASP